ncbi:MAG TPA: prepilin-type N-terminal cleavage/methylation domain-containing protein [Candidatus Paceibacterota bacterium]|nr:prepilin-type N-terminal cleavage/methylation domain-containing protein [Candidatus Paceibacterota bacterium]HPT40383.1 prepilin-type N-terminal cleavage/methylation domain-containing protein [Candidatus Paceibacterota bacterium]
MIKIKNSNRGFTLMELLIVVAIIGLLASMILVGLSSFRTRGRDARRISDVKQAQNGLEIYYAKETKYPSVPSSGEPGTIDASAGWEAVTNAIVGGGIGITQLSQDPLGKEHSYAYASESDTSNPQSYVIGVALEDSGNQALKSDLDETIFGMDCGDANADTIYCVQF